MILTSAIPEKGKTKDAATVPEPPHLCIGHPKNGVFKGLYR
jgi:hypothetical protein